MSKNKHMLRGRVSQSKVVLAWGGPERDFALETLQEGYPEQPCTRMRRVRVWFCSVVPCRNVFWRVASVVTSFYRKLALALAHGNQASLEANCTSWCSEKRVVLQPPYTVALLEMKKVVSETCPFVHVFSETAMVPKTGCTMVTQ